jgi:hypothetical protein
MMTMAILMGIWTTTCIQTQISNMNQGFAKETYTIGQNGEYEFKREWFKDSGCKEPHGTDVESGTIELGSKIQSMFASGETFEANFSSQHGVDLGAMSVREKKFLKIARGMRNSSMRNTMVGIFEYAKQ